MDYNQTFHHSTSFQGIHNLITFANFPSVMSLFDCQSHRNPWVRPLNKRRSWCFSKYIELAKELVPKERRQESRMKCPVDSGWCQNSRRVNPVERQMCVSLLTLCDPMDFSPPVSSVLWIFLARILEWVTISFSRGSSRPRDQTHFSCVSCTGRGNLYHCATSESRYHWLY